MFTLTQKINFYILKFGFIVRLYAFNPGLIRGLSRLSRLLKINLNYRLRFKKESDDCLDQTINHNMISLKSTPLRMNLLIKPLSVIESVSKKSSVLIIGPRSEWDLFLCGNEGFSNVRGLDLISYSSLIDIGDMHELSLNFETNSYDIVLCGWTLSYSTNPQKVANQIAVITKDGGFIGIGLEYADDNPSNDSKWLERDGYSLINREKLRDRINSVKQILDLFHDFKIKVYFQHDAPLKRAHNPCLPLLKDVSNVAVIFQIFKR